MSRKQYVRDNRFMWANDSKDNGKSLFKRILIGLVAIIVIGGIVFGGAFLNSKISIDKSYKEFVLSCDNKDYSKAVVIYRKIQEKTLSVNLFSMHQKERQDVLLKMESIVNLLIETPFNELINNQKAFGLNDITVMKEFLELSSRKVSIMVSAYLDDYLLGKYKKDTVITTFNELKKVDNFSDTVSHYENELDSISLFSLTMVEIDKELKEGNYLSVATRVKTEIDNQSGFIKEYLNRFYLKCKNEMYPILKSDIDVMMTGSKYYSAKSLIDQLIIFFPQDAFLLEKIKKCEENVTKKLVEYNLPVEHISLRPLIATPSLAFDNDSYSKNAEDLMLTVNEFQKILAGLYSNNYILIDINTLVNSAGQKNRLFFPEGKKPIILSIEGLNYYAGRSRSGNSDNLFIDSNDNIVSSYKNSSGDAVTDRNGEAIGILEQFIEAHQDFSFDGSKGNISLTGFECIFGYVTNDDQVDDRTKAYIDNLLSPFSITPQEISANKDKVIEIITKLKNKGWTFSSSTYGNILVADSTIDVLKNDTEKWMEQVGTLTGSTKTLLFPSGSFVGSKDERGAYLVGKGFLIQSGIGPWAYFNFSETNLYMDRISLNGLALRFQDLSRFFDVKTVYDPSRTISLK